MHIINTDNLMEGYIPLGELPTLRRPNEMLHILLYEGTLVHILKTPAIPFVAGGVQYLLDEPGFRVRQLELPLQALAWIVDMVETAFWHEHHVVKELYPLPKRILINGEKLRLCFIPNYGANATKGITIENFSRRGKYLDWQEMGFTHNTLQQAGLLAMWKQILWNYPDRLTGKNAGTEFRVT